MIDILNSGAIPESLEAKEKLLQDISQTCSDISRTSAVISAKSSRGRHPSISLRQVEKALLESNQQGRVIKIRKLIKLNADEKAKLASKTAKLASQAAKKAANSKAQSENKIFTEVTKSIQTREAKNSEPAKKSLSVIASNIKLPETQSLAKQKEAISSLEFNNKSKELLTKFHKQRTPLVFNLKEKIDKAPQNYKETALLACLSISGTIGDIERTKEEKKNIKYTDILRESVNSTLQAIAIINNEFVKGSSETADVILDNFKDIQKDGVEILDEIPKISTEIIELCYEAMGILVAFDLFTERDNSQDNVLDSLTDAAASNPIIAELMEKDLRGKEFVRRLDKTKGNIAGVEDLIKKELNFLFKVIDISSSDKKNIPGKIFLAINNNDSDSVFERLEVLQNVLDLTKQMESNASLNSRMPETTKEDKALQSFKNKIQGAIAKIDTNSLIKEANKDRFTREIASQAGLTEKLEKRLSNQKNTSTLKQNHSTYLTR